MSDIYTTVDFRPGWGNSICIYSPAGRPGLYNRRDKNGSVAQHVERMQRMWGPTVEKFLASGSVGASPKTIAGGGTPHGQVPETSTARK